MRSLRARLVAGTTAGMAAVLLAAGAVVYVLVRASLIAQLDSAVRDKAALLASAVELEGRKVDLEFDELDLSAYRDPAGPGYLQLRRDDGSAVYRSPSLQARDLESVPPAAGAAPRCRWVDLAGGRAGRAVTLAFHPRRDGDEDEEADANAQAPPAAMTLTLAWDASQATAALASLRTVLIVVGLLAMGSSAALLWLVIRRSLAPVRRIAERIARLDERNLAQEVPLGAAPSELRPVVHRLNDLLARLDAAFERERGFSADVAHELRTPLAALRTTLEVAASRPREPDQYREMIDDSRQVVTRMHRMVENLLALARLESGQVDLAPEEVVLADVARTEWRCLADLAETRKLQVRWVGDSQRPVVTDRSLAALIVRSVLDNAVAHADEAGSVEIDLRDDGSAVCLRVANTGSTISREQARMVFERFWRGDAARSGGDHCGLGLSLAKRAADLLDAAIEASASGDGRFEVTVRLPRPE